MILYYKLVQDEAGEYVAADGTRYFVAAARCVRNSKGLNVGYTPFPSLEEALAAWGLRPYALTE